MASVTVGLPHRIALSSISLSGPPFVNVSTTMSSVTSPPSASPTSETHDTEITPVIVAPSTPQRGRTVSRYPSHLSVGDPGRVPLHRRGTSKTYERLEDLLREAGYKETRIFTPEADRTEERAKQDAKSVRSFTSRSGVGAVMDFISGWIPGANRQDDGSLTDSESAVDDSQPWRRSLPASPLAHKRILPSHSGSSLTAPPPHTSLLTHSLPHANPRVLPHHQFSSGNLRTYAQVSAARNHLRHMASAPNVARVQSSRRPHTADPHTPPLPHKWFESVTKVVLGSSSTDAHIGGPQPSHPSSRQSLRTLRSTAKSSALTDRTNRRPRPPPLNSDCLCVPPAALTAYLNAPQTASIAVSAVRVVCRSAPASRSSSRVGERSTLTADAGISQARSSRWPKSARSGTSDNVPSLASTQLENDDAWAAHWVDGVRISNTSDDDTDHDEDDGELDLARLLVPPKRQHSIRSLRRHLHRSESARVLRSPENRMDPWASEEEDGTRSSRVQSLRGRSKRNSMEDDEGHSLGWETGGAPSFDQTGTKRRRGLPGTWAKSNLGSGSVR
ncbi:hypothetical protein BXZ70DRAFT_958477 [Cristinia sonorae]|uniref:Uncharacterized protein n=1 Tax=Cristinia sonorae TaxID=1940300 RepID=A0A8K0UFZ5_9AGAR|nr:hypothetical protein BXZ70DRAFT_958477 [Cristinia sonorae]